jgi:hypothetical protein
VAQPSAFEDTFQQLTPFLLDQGWLFTPRMLGGEVRALWDACEPFQTAAPLDDKRRRAAEHEINRILVFYASHENFRAYYVWLAMQQPHVSPFSHLIENGVFHFYKRDYLSCVLSLLPAVEGTLRAHWAAHNPPLEKPARLGCRRMTRFLRGPRPEKSYTQRHALYRNALADFLDRWLWTPTEEADFSLSFLNRHLILHGLGAEHSYRSVDCDRLFLFLDLYMEMLTLETGVGAEPFIPTHVPAIARRARLYRFWRLFSERIRPSSPRLGLLREHPHFHDEPVREDFLSELERWRGVMGLDRQGAGDRRGEAGGAPFVLRVLTRKFRRGL